MGDNCGSWFSQQAIDLPSPCLNPWYSPLHSAPSFVKPDNYMVNLLEYPSNGLPNQAREPNAWFYGLPRFRQAFMPANSIPKEKKNNSPIGHDNYHDATASKKFLVVDQSGDKTTLIFSSGVEDPAHHLNSWGLKPSATCNNLNIGISSRTEDLNIGISSFGSSPMLIDESSPDVLSEMHEDTEELNALLYSDDDSDYSDDDDEVTSTGHSPSTMTAHDNKLDLLQEIASSSSMGLSKKRKLVDREDDVDDAESSCGYSKSSAFPSAGNKKMKNEQLRETVDILRSIVPDLQGKDVVTVLDEAIQYLRSLKVKARDLGLDNTTL